MRALWGRFVARVYNFIGCMHSVAYKRCKTAHPWLGWAYLGFYDWKCYLRLRGMPLRVST